MRVSDKLSIDRPVAPCLAVGVCRMKLLQGIAEVDVVPNTPTARIMADYTR